MNILLADVSSIINAADSPTAPISPSSPLTPSSDDRSCTGSYVGDEYDDANSHYFIPVAYYLSYTKCQIGYEWFLKELSLELGGKLLLYILYLSFDFIIIHK